MKKIIKKPVARTLGAAGKANDRGYNYNSPRLLSCQYFFTGKHKKTLEEFLAKVIADGGAPPSPAKTRVFAKDPHSEKVKQHFIHPAHIATLVELWIAENPDLAYWHIFYSPSFELNAQNRMDGKASYVSSLAIDIDNINETELVRRVNEAPVKPRFVVSTGGGFHLYFALSGIHKADELKPIYDGLNSLYDGDRGASYHNGYLRRLPFTYNCKPKYDKPRFVELVKISDKRYTVPELIELLNDFTSESHSNMTLKTPLLFTKQESPDLKALKEDLTKEHKRFWGLVKKDWKLKAVMTGKDHRIKKAPSGSERDFIYAMELFARGFTVEFVYNELWRWKYGIVHNSNRTEQTNREKARRLRLIVKEAKNKTSLKRRILCKMETGKSYSAPALARRVKARVADVAHALKELYKEGAVIKRRKVRKGRTVVLYMRKIKSLVINGITIRIS